MMMIASPNLFGVMIAAALILSALENSTLAAATTADAAFLPSSIRQQHRSFVRRSGTSLRYRNLPPTIEQVSTDSFTEQVYHASELIRQLDLQLGKQDLPPATPPPAFPPPHSASPTTPPAAAASIEEEEEETLPLIGEIDDNDAINPRELTEEELSELIIAQFSHQDGIRGFFVAYLTGPGGATLADGDDVPKQLVEAMKRCNLEDLAPHACMNVVIPTAMASLHDDPTMSSNSAKTAERAWRILDALRGSINISKNCQAVAVAAGAGGEGQEAADETLVKFWEGVFNDYGYEAKQKEDIARQFSQFM